MRKKLSSLFSLVVLLGLAWTSDAFASPIVAGANGRSSITPPTGATSVSNILDLCDAVDSVFNRLAGDDACDDHFTSSDTSLDVSSSITLFDGLALRVDGLSMTYRGAFSLFSFEGGSLVVGSGYYASERSCLFTLRDANDFASPYNETTDELLLLGGTFEYLGEPIGDFAASPICIMTGYKTKQASLDYAKLFLPENYTFVNADTGEEIKLENVELGLASINKSSPTSVYYLNARRITIAYREPEIDDPTPDDPTPDDPVPDDPVPDDPTPDNPTPDNPTPDEPTPPAPDEPQPEIILPSAPKTPDTAGGSCETFIESITPRGMKSSTFIIAVALCLTTYTLMIVIFTTLLKIHNRLKP